MFIKTLFVTIVATIAFSVAITSAAQPPVVNISSAQAITHSTANKKSSAAFDSANVEVLKKILASVIAANRYYSYDALLTYEANGSLSTLRLSHQIDYNKDQQSQVVQTLAFLDGVDRSIVREQKLAACDSGQTRWGVWPPYFNIDNMQSLYRISLLGEERVADRQTLVLDFSPKDQFRYGHRFNVDKQTGLILRSQVLQESNIIERSQFVSLTLNDLSNEADVQPSASLNNSTMSWRVPEADACHTEQFQSAWSVSWLPDGFVSAGNRITAKGEQVLMFTDGLVSISVFITAERYHDVPKLTAQRGATVAVIAPSVVSDSSSVAVVGEIPAVTARRIAVSVRSQ